MDKLERREQRVMRKMAKNWNMMQNQVVDSSSVDPHSKEIAIKANNYKKYRRIWLKKFLGTLSSRNQSNASSQEVKSNTRQKGGSPSERLKSLMLIQD